MSYDTTPIAPALSRLFSEVMDGPPQSGGYLLNGGDPGLLHSLDRLSAEDASTEHEGGASIAAHAAHILYGLSLLIRWAQGEQNPWADADWSASWRQGQVDQAEWTTLRQNLRRAGSQWLATLREGREVNEMELPGYLASVAHTAYHLGAIRQIDRSTRGPSAEE